MKCVQYIHRFLSLVASFSLIELVRLPTGRCTTVILVLLYGIFMKAKEQNLIIDFYLSQSSPTDLFVTMFLRFVEI